MDILRNKVAEYEGVIRELCDTVKGMQAQEKAFKAEQQQFVHQLQSVTDANASLKQQLGVAEEELSHARTVRCL